MYVEDLTGESLYALREGLFLVTKRDLTPIGDGFTNERYVTSVTTGKHA